MDEDLIADIGKAFCSLTALNTLLQHVATELSKENADLRQQKPVLDTSPVLDVFDQYRHLDGILCDLDWICGGDPSPRSRCLYDLWQAVRTTAVRAGKVEP